MRLSSFLAGALCAATIAAAVAVSAQSLGDVAKKEEERRKSVPQPAKVYTNKDLSAVPPSSAPPAAAEAPKPASEADTAKDADKDAKDKDKDPVKDKAYWAGRKKSLEEALDRDQTYADGLQSRINALSTDFVNRDDPAQRAVIERDRQKAMAELQRLQKQIQDDKKALTDLDEEARRAGVPPGWLR